MLSRDQLLNKEIILARKAYFAVALRRLHKGEMRLTGANVCLEVVLTGKLDPQTELAVNFSDVDTHLNHFLGLVDHRNVELDLRPNANSAGVTDAEFLLRMAWENLAAKLQFPFAKLTRINLYLEPHECLSLTGDAS